ncbi:MAG TPA: hypothetical protein VIM02_09785 [Rhizomicrobium sp.]|jgi:hypothetical protein
MLGNERGLIADGSWMSPRAASAFAMLIFILGVHATAGTSEADPGIAALTDAQFDAQYRCPETLPDSERAKEVANYLLWAQTQHPQWTVGDALKERYRLFQKHQCYVTLEAIHENSTHEK